MARLVPLHLFRAVGLRELRPFYPCFRFSEADVRVGPLRVKLRRNVVTLIEFANNLGNGAFRAALPAAGVQNCTFRSQLRRRFNEFGH